MKCNNCEKPATVHLTQIINSKIIKVDFCEDCAKEKGITDPEGFSLADLLSKSQVSVQKKDADLHCPSCGMKTVDFRRTGRMGCSDCFGIFTPLLKPVLEDMHVGTHHIGKVPEVAIERRNTSARLEKLEDSLERAIANEAYEEAARYRDEIKLLKDEAVNFQLSES